MDYFSLHERYPDPHKAAELFEKIHKEFLSRNSDFEPVEAERMLAPLFAAYKKEGLARLHVIVTEDDAGRMLGVNCLMTYDDPPHSMLVYTATRREGPNDLVFGLHGPALVRAAQETHAAHFEALGKENVPMFIEIPCQNAQGAVKLAGRYDRMMGLERVGIKWAESLEDGRYTLAVTGHNGRSLEPATVLACMENHARFVSGLVKGELADKRFTPYFEDPASLRTDHEFADMASKVGKIAERNSGTIPVAPLEEIGLKIISPRRGR